jgi:hypothetical protein
MHLTEVFALKRFSPIHRGGLVGLNRKSFFNFNEHAKSMRKWVNFWEISQNLVSRNFSFPRKFSLQTFAKVVAKTKNLKEFDSDPVVM